MTTLLLALLVALCLALLTRGFWEKGRMYEYPFLAAAVVLGWVVPQLIGLTAVRDLPPWGLEITILMTVLCLGMCYGGDVVARRPTNWFRQSYSEGRLLWASAVFAAVGAYSFWKISRLPPELAPFGQVWTGLATRYNFFAHLMRYGLVIALLLCFKRRSLLAFAIVVLCGFFYADRILIAARRATIIDIGLSVLLGLWFQRRWVIPRAAMLVLLVLGTLFVFSTAAYRAVTQGHGIASLQEIANIEYTSNFRRALAEGGPEVRNAVFDIAATQRRLSFDYGLAHWDKLVFMYVPAQLFGREFKQSLMIPFENVAYREFYYVPSVGSTNTGMADAFQSFWFFGGINFFVIAFVMAKLYRAAVAGNFAAQTLFIIMTYPALSAITHDTNRFVSAWVYAAVFLFPALHWARIGVFPPWMNLRGYIDKRQLDIIGSCPRIDAAKERS